MSLTIDFHEFTYREYVDVCAAAGKSKEGRRESRKAKEDFTGTKNFKEALMFAREGWDYGLEQMPLDDGLLADSGVEFNPNVVGAVVNIPNYINGQPDCMWEYADLKDYNLPDLTIYVQLRYSGVWTTREALEYCKGVMDIINEHQSKNRVRLVGVFDKKTKNSTRFITYITIKDFDDPMVLNNIAFSFHPSFFRRLHFAHCESLPHWYVGGYGTSISESNVIERLSEYHGTQEKGMYLPSMERHGTKIDPEKIIYFN